MWRLRSYIGLGLVGIYLALMILTIKSELECTPWIVSPCGIAYAELGVPWIFLLAPMGMTSDHIPLFLIPFYIVNIPLLYGIGALIGASVHYIIIQITNGEQTYSIYRSLRKSNRLWHWYSSIGLVFISIYLIYIMLVITFGLTYRRVQLHDFPWLEACVYLLIIYSIGIVIHAFIRYLFLRKWLLISVSLWYKLGSRIPLMQQIASTLRNI